LHTGIRCCTIRNGRGITKNVIRAICAATLSSFLVTIAAAQAAGGAGAAEPAATVTAVDETTLVLPEEADGGGTAERLDGSVWPYFLRMLLSLALVVAAIYGVFRILKRTGAKADEADPFIRVLAATRIGQGRWLHVVALGEKAWLVGSTDSQVSLVAAVEDKELVDAMVLRSAQAPVAPRTDFSSLLQSMLKRTPRGRAAGTGEVPGTDYLARQRERLRKNRDR